MSSPSEQFYEKMKDLQENQHKSEQKRLELEQQLHLHMKSDSRLARLKAVRLQNYWKKICEDEKKSQWRNEQLLKDLERIDAHVENMSSITNKLRTKKKQYEEYIERTYPQWKEKVIQYQQQRKASNEAKERQLNAEAEGRSQFAEEQLQLQQQVLQKHNEQLNYLLQEKEKQQQQYTQGYGRAGTNYNGSYGQMQGGIGTQGYQASMGEVPYQPSAQNMHQPRVNFQSTPEMHRHSEPQQHQQPTMAPSGVSTLQTVSTLPTGLSATPQVPLQQQVNQQPGISSQPHKIPTASQGMYTTQEEEEQSDREVDLSVGQLSSPRKTPRSPHKHTSDGVGSPKKVTRTPPISPRGEKKVEKSPRPSFSDRTLDDGSDIESDISLPLSDTKEKPATPVPTPTPRKSSLKPEQQTPRATSEAEVYPEPDVTRDGFYNMLSAVQDDFASTRDPEAFYRSPEDLMKSVEKQIYENANKGANLSHFSSTSISMAVLEQVPLLALDCEGGHLLPDSILKSFPADINEETVRESIRKTSVGFWEKLLEHFKAMMKYQVMEPYKIADIFAPLLIGARSNFEEEAKNLVTALLENLPQDALVMTPNSTTTFSSLPMSARRPEPEEKPKPKEEVPPLDLEFETTENTNDDFFDKPVPKPSIATNANTLTQSAAYKALLGTGSTMEPDTDSSEDDIEKTLNFGSERKDSPRKPMFSGPGPQGDGAVNAERPPSPESSLSAASSPRVEALDQKGSYVPTAASDKPAKSTLQLTGSSAGKSPRVYGIIRDSDTDEDIEIPSAGATGNKMAQEDDDDEYDDEDFYR